MLFLVLPAALALWGSPGSLQPDASVEASTTEPSQPPAQPEGLMAVWAGLQRASEKQRAHRSSPSLGSLLSAANASTTETQLTLLNNHQALPPLPPANMTIPATLEQLTLAEADAVVERHSPEGVWERVVHNVAASRQLRIAIVGASSTSGCGAAEPSPRCDTSMAWGRRMHDTLRAALAGVPGWTAEVSTHIYFKNAVDPSYFASCTTGIVPADADLVLFEVATNLWGGGRAGLDGMLAAARGVAPNASLAFVLWPSQGIMADSDDKEVKLVQSAAMTHGADVVLIPALLRQLSHGAELALREQSVHYASWYAKHGKDQAHPNPEGHKLIASVAARYVANSLLSAFFRPRAAALPPAPKPALPVATNEICFTRADMLPVKQPLEGSWALRDEGAAKGVLKLGYVSTSLGESLDVGPLPPTALHPATGCAGLIARLGYHMSSYPGQGALQVQCQGCTCAPIRGYWQETVWPFPHVETDTSLNKELFPFPEQVHRANISVTAVTSFSLQQSRDVPCYVHLTHVRSKHPRAPTSRVRVDSLTMRAADAGDVRNANHSTADRLQKGFASFSGACAPELLAPPPVDA